MTCSVEEFDIPYGCGGNGDDEGKCDSKTKGFVLHVEKCEEHDHWIHLHSFGKSEYQSDAHTEITTGTDFKIIASGGCMESISGDKEQSIGGEKNVTIQGEYTLTAPKTTLWTHVFTPPRPKTHPNDCAAPTSFKDCLVGDAFKECKNHGCFDECLNPDGFDNCKDHGCLYDLNRILEWLGTIDVTIKSLGDRITALEAKG